MKNTAFFVGLAAFLTHEIDAMPNHEWRLLPVLSSLPDELGMSVFVWLHVPIYAALIAALASTHERIREMSRLGFALFLAAHGVAHALFKRHPDYEFATFTSDALIFGAAFLGVVYLAIAAWQRNPGRA